MRRGLLGAAALISATCVWGCSSAGSGPSAASVFRDAPCSIWLARLPTAAAYLERAWQEAGGRYDPFTFYSDAKRAIERACARHSRARPFLPAVQILGREIRSSLGLLQPGTRSGPK